jgi:hypothetical protein
MVGAETIPVSVEIWVSLAERQAMHILYPVRSPHPPPGSLQTTTFSFDFQSSYSQWRSCRSLDPMICCTTTAMIPTIWTRV